VKVIGSAYPATQPNVLLDPLSRNILDGFGLRNRLNKSTVNSLARNYSLLIRLGCGNPTDPSPADAAQNDGLL
jgi:hypothetical protein